MGLPGTVLRSQLGALVAWADRRLSGIPRGELTLLGVILFVALLMRLWGGSFGLPHIYHSDEGFEVYRALRLGTGEMDVDRIAKGGYYLLLFAEYLVYFVWMFITRAVTGLEDFASSFVRDPSARPQAGSRLGADLSPIDRWERVQHR